MERIGELIRYFIPGASLLKFEQLTGGVIHGTYRLVLEQDTAEQVYILQKLNSKVFPNTRQLMYNTRRIQQFLKSGAYPFQLSEPLAGPGGHFYYRDHKGQDWRLFKNITNSTSYDTVQNDQQVFEAGKAFGLFLAHLKDFQPQQLYSIIPDFHNLHNRFEVFKKKIKNAGGDQKKEAQLEIEKIISLFERFQFIDFSKLPLRVVHNDCKLSNLLFDKNTRECLAVIDLDTVMPGYLVTDFGDMVRSMCCTVSEEERDTEKVAFLPMRYLLLQKGFLQATATFISEAESTQLFNGAVYIILEQALRFLSDYLNRDRYYAARYPSHNLDRSRNQLKLLESMLESEIGKY